MLMMRGNDTKMTCPQLKTKTAYPSDDALRKIIYLATVEAAKKWTMPLRSWKECISQLAVHFGDRLQAELSA